LGGTFVKVGVELVRKLTKQASLEVIALGSPDDFVQPTVDGMAEQVKLVQGYVDVATALGASVVSLKVGTPKEGVSEAEAINLIIKGLQHVAPYARDRR
ncbi:MAG TPA: hypothetical protein VMW65_01450, partial [Chloroflexota bacterium]|nr:hypothetical protein [Chloroflexota bacterium]